MSQAITVARLGLNHDRFRWIELQLALFFPKNPRVLGLSQIQHRLAKLEDRIGVPDLEEAYEEIYRRTTEEDEDYKHDLDLALSWMLACEWSLDIEHLIEVITFEHERCAKSTSGIHEEYVLGLTSDLLVLDEENDLQFAHASVKEFLQVQPRLCETFSEIKTHVQVAVNCLYHVLKHAPKLPPVISFETPELAYSDRYAFEYWPWHCELAGPEERQKSPLKDLFEELLLAVPVGVPFRNWLDWADIHYLMKDELIAESSRLTPWFVACRWGYAEVIDTLLLHDPSIMDVRNSADEGSTGLVLAVTYNQIEVVRRLLDPAATARANVNAHTADGSTALIAAAEANDLEMIEALLNDPAIDVNCRFGSSGGPALLWCAEKGNAKAVSLLLHHGADVNMANPDDETAVLLAVGSEDLDTLDTLLQAPGIDVNAPDTCGNVPLKVAANIGNVEMIKRLVGKGAKIQSIVPREGEGESAEMTARNESFGVLIKALLEEPDPGVINTVDSSGRVALFWAIEDHAERAVQALLRRGANVNWQDSRGNTALHVAARRGATSITKMLLSQPDIDVNIRDNSEDHETALQIAARYGNLYQGEMFLNSGAHISLENLRQAARVTGGGSWEKDELANLLENRLALEELGCP